MDWYNPPQSYRIESEQITVTTLPKTDFWRETHYGFIRDNGHFLYQTIQGNFSVAVKIRGAYKDLYDQAGIMIRLDENTWMKCGIEFVNGIQQASAVVTRNYSDWSVVPLSRNPPEFWLQVSREGTALEIKYSLDGQQYNLLRLAYLTGVEMLQVGLMCASPDGEGFTTTFEDFVIRT